MVRLHETHVAQPTTTNGEHHERFTRQAHNHAGSHQGRRVTAEYRGWAIEHDRPWWYAEWQSPRGHDGNPLAGRNPKRASTKAQLLRMIDRDEDAS